MITLKHTQTNEVLEISALCIYDGRIAAYHKNAEPSENWIKAHPQVIRTEQTVTDSKHGVTCRVFKLAEGWEIVKSDRKPRQPRTPKTPETPQPTEVVVADEAETPQPQTQATNASADVQALYELISRIGGSNTPATIDASAVRKIVTETLCEYAHKDNKRLQAIARTAANNEGVHCANFDEICDYVAQGQPVYMYGAAGCGKSHTAEQVAQALGLEFYSQSQVLFAHDVKGYGDANGNYQQTPFYKAFTQGGLFFIDEMDASAAEALVVLNTAIANRRYDFPVIGNVQAHPNFRIIAAGNTAMTGADMEYTARFVQDASTRNRFTFFRMAYDKRVELPVMAKGDEVLYNFVCDLRNAIKQTGVQLCVSYRQTAVLASELSKKYGKQNALARNVFAGMEEDDIQVLYGALTDTTNTWSKAMKGLCK